MKNARFIRLFPIACLLLSGCFTVKGEYLLYSSNNNVAKDVYDQGVRDHIDHLATGPRVDGSDCESALFGLIPLPPSFHIIPSQEKAFASAMKKAGPPYDALINMEWSVTQYLVPPPLLRVICWDVSGVAVRNKQYYPEVRTPSQNKLK